MPVILPARSQSSTSFSYRCLRVRPLPRTLVNPLRTRQDKSLRIKLNRRFAFGSDCKRRRIHFRNNNDSFADEHRRLLSAHYRVRSWRPDRGDRPEPHLVSPAHSRRSPPFDGDPNKVAPGLGHTGRCRRRRTRNVFASFIRRDARA